MQPPTRFLLLAGAALALGVSPLAAADSDADNTGRNEQANQGPTADSQSNAPEDVKLAGEIRRAVIGDDELSMAAKNVKIMTKDGTATLRGPVKNAKEKTTIEALAKKAGAKTVNNELEVEKKP